MPIVGHSRSDRLFDATIYALVAFVVVVTLYPVIYVLSLSFSSARFVERGMVWFWPRGFTLSAYELIYRHEYILGSYVNTLIYVTAGTVYSMVLTICGAYSLSRKRLPGRDFFMLIVAFTMLFNGGLIPTYILVRSLGIVNTRLVMIIPMAVGVWNLVILRTAMMQMPDSIEESAKMDGANDYQILFRIILPMTTASVFTIGLFYVVAKWNDFFRALIYLNDKDLYPLQLIVRELVIAMSDLLIGQEMTAGADDFTPMSFRAAVIVITMLPLLVFYPFVQRYFVKGVMIGAIKG